MTESPISPSAVETPRAVAKKKQLTPAQKIKAAALITAKLNKLNVAEKSLGFMKVNHPVRSRVLKLVQSTVFEYASISIIIANCVFLAIYDPLDFDGSGSRNLAIADAELPFNILFTVEMVCKIIALGFVGKGSYLGDRWNWLDFFIVVMGYVGMIPGMTNFSALRTFRVLRPLRTLSTMPGMRVIVGSILSSVPALANVALLAVFSLIVFGIIGVQLWSGLLKGQCGYFDPTDNATWIWGSSGTFCALPCSAQKALGADVTDCTDAYGQSCPILYVPQDQYDVNGTALGYQSMVPVEQECLGTDNPVWGTVGFDNVALAFMTLFTAITCEGWTDTMYAVMQTWGVRPLVAIYFVFLILFGAFFMLQLALAVIWESYQRSETQELVNAEALLREWGHLLPRKKKKKLSVVEGLGAMARTLSQNGSTIKTMLITALSPKASSEDNKKGTTSGNDNNSSSGGSMVVGSTSIAFPLPAPPPSSSTYNNSPSGKSNTNTESSAAYAVTDWHAQGTSNSNNRTVDTGSDLNGNATTSSSSSTNSNINNSNSNGPSTAAFIGGLFGLNNKINQVVPVSAAEGGGSAPPLLMGSDPKEYAATTEGRNPKSTLPPILIPPGSSDNSSSHSVSTSTPTSASGCIAGAANATALLAFVGLQKANSVNNVEKLGGVSSSITNDNNNNAAGGSSISAIQRIESASISPDGNATTTNTDWEYDVEDDPPPKPLPPPLIPAIHRFVESPLFGNFIIFVIVLNTIQLALPYKGMSDEYSNALDIMNFIFSAVFGLEMILKLVGSGPKIYVASTFNIFDGLVVIMSFVDIALTAISGNSAGGLAALRTLRLARVFKLARAWGELRKLMSTILFALSNVSNAVVVLLIIMFIFTLLGMQLIGGQFQALVENGVMDELPRTNWDTFWWGFVSTFQIITGENWNAVLGDCYEAIGGIAIVYLFLLNIIGNYMFLNLFLAILLGCFEAAMEEEAAAAEAAALEAEKKKQEELKALEDSRATQVVEDEGGGGDIPAKEKSNETTTTMTIAEMPVNPSSADASSSLIEGDVQMSDLKNSANTAKGSASTSTSSTPQQTKKTGNHSATAALNGSNPMSSPSDGASADAVNASHNSNNNKPSHAASGAHHNGGGAHGSANASQGGGPATAQAKMDMNNGAPKEFQANLSMVDPTSGESRQVAIRVLPSGDVQIAAGAGDTDDPNRPKGCNPAAAYYSLKMNVQPDANGQYHRNQISLGCLTPASPIRGWAAALVTHPWFDKFILLLILISSINLALDEPRVGYCKTLPEDDPEQCLALAAYLKWADIIITAMFVLEMVLKIVSLGFFATPVAYLATSWNALDFIIVIISVLSLALESAASQLKALRSLRALRALRPLRVVSRYPGLKLVVNAVLTAIPKVKTVVLINFLFYLILAVVGLQNFSGALDYCNDPNISALEDCVGTFQVSGDGCVIMPTDWAETLCRQSLGTDFPRTINTWPQNYDTIFHSIMTVFEVSTGEAWPDIMSYAVDSTSAGQPQQRDSQPAVALYFIIIQVVCSMFLLELFTGIIIANYDELKDLNKGSGLLTPEQQLWVEQMKLMMTASPKKQMIRPTTPKNSLLGRKIRNRIYDVAVSLGFEIFIMGVILANTAVLAMKYFGQSPDYINAIEWANNVFALIFACEACIKLIAYGPKQYFFFNWNRFDFSLVCASALGVAFSLGPLATLLRVVRVARIFRLIRTSKGLLLLFKTLIVSLPSLANVGTILLLVYYIFSIVAMNLFAGIRYGFGGSGLSAEGNFNSFFTAMLTLFRCSTGENFNAIMHDLEVQPPYCDMDFGNCGGNVAPSIFFSLFSTLTTFIIIKLLVAVVLDSFSDTLSAEEQQEEFRLTPDVMDQYTEVWERCDPLATKFLDDNGLIKLMMELDYPLGLKNSPGVRHDITLRKQALKVIAELSLRPDTHGKYQFHTVLQELSKRASGGKELVATTMQLSGTDQQVYSSREQIMAIRIQGVFRARRARRHMAERKRKVAAGEIVLPTRAELDAAQNGERLVKVFRRQASRLVTATSFSNAALLRSGESRRAIQAELNAGKVLRYLDKAAARRKAVSGGGTGMNGNTEGENAGNEIEGASRIDEDGGLAAAAADDDDADARPVTIGNIFTRTFSRRDLGSSNKKIRSPISARSLAVVPANNQEEGVGSATSSSSSSSSTISSGGSSSAAASSSAATEDVPSGTTEDAPPTHSEIVAAAAQAAIEAKEAEDAALKAAEAAAVAEAEAQAAIAEHKAALEEEKVVDEPVLPPQPEHTDASLPTDKQP